MRATFARNSLFAGENLGPGRGWNVSTGGVLCPSLFDRFVPILPYDLRRSCLPNLVLKDICCGRTIERELDSSGRFIPPCCVSLSSCLDVSRIKGLWTDAIVSWDINALLQLYVGVREAAVGVVAPWESQSR